MKTQMPTIGTAMNLGLLGAATLAGGVVLAVRPRHDKPIAISTPLDRTVAVRAARRLNRASGTIATSVLIDSAVEHYRGGFHNRAMYTPLVTSALALAASLHGTRDDSPAAHAVRDTIYAGTALTGVAGTAFHIYNVGKKPGGFCWQNLFYSAPLGAPAALVLSGLMGFLAERVRDNEPGTLPTVLGLSAGRAIAAATGAGILGTVGEAGLLHLRGAYHNPFMLLPVTLPPVAAVLLGGVAVGEARTARPITRWWLRCTALLGVVGVGFHTVGVARNMGGLAELAAERAGRAANPGSARLYRPGACRARSAWAAGGSSR